MKKAILFIAGILFSLNSYSQTVTFNNLLHLLKEKNVKGYLTSAPLNFTDDGKFDPFDKYVKNKGTGNEELIRYEGKKPVVEYTVNNVSFIYKLIKQIKYPLILKSVDPKTSTFYQFGNLKMHITIDIYKTHAIIDMYEN